MILTPREREVASLVATGATNRAIAEELGVGIRTIGVHLQNISLKLNLINRTQIAIWVVKRASLDKTSDEPTVFKFNYYLGRGYACNKPGDNSGYYVSLNEYERLRRKYERIENELSNHTTGH